MPALSKAPTPKNNPPARASSPPCDIFIITQCRERSRRTFKRKPTRNARQYADRIARTATERADSTEPPRTLTPTAKKESAPHQPTKANRETHHIKGKPIIAWFARKVKEYTMSSTEILSLVEQYKEAQQLIEAAQARWTTSSARSLKR